MRQELCPTVGKFRDYLMPFIQPGYKIKGLIINTWKVKTLTKIIQFHLLFSLVAN